jgi:cytochrome oxidase Cu insertion factor (SCO1/SenC/PrrC family)
MDIQPTMKPEKLQSVLMMLLAVASVGVTALVVLSVMKQGRADARQKTEQPAADAEIFLGGPTPDNPSALAPPANPPILGAISAFQLTRSDGGPIDAAFFQNKIWVADFIFSRCSGPCPMMTSRMAALQATLRSRADWKNLQSNLLLVSVSVDPEHDSPEVLRRYAELAQADPKSWLFLTGPRDEVWRLIKDGFKLPVFQESPGGSGPIVHSPKFVLIDGHARVRGYYDVLETEGYSPLLHDLDRLIAEANPGAIDSAGLNTRE